HGGILGWVGERTRPAGGVAGGRGAPVLGPGNLGGTALGPEGARAGGYPSRPAGRGAVPPVPQAVAAWSRVPGGDALADQLLPDRRGHPSGSGDRWRAAPDPHLRRRGGQGREDRLERDPAARRDAGWLGQGVVRRGVRGRVP